MRRRRRRGRWGWRLGAESVIGQSGRGSAESRGRACFQSLGCAQHRLARAQPASHERRNAHAGSSILPQAWPIRSPVPRKIRHPTAPLVSCPCHAHAPPMVSHVPMSVQFLPTDPPPGGTSTPLLKAPHIRAMLAFARDRPRPPATGHRPPACCPPLSRGVTVLPRTSCAAIQIREEPPPPPATNCGEWCEMVQEFASRLPRDDSAGRVN